MDDGQWLISMYHVHPAWLKAYSVTHWLISFHCQLNLDGYFVMYWAHRSFIGIFVAIEISMTSGNAIQWSDFLVDLGLISFFFFLYEYYVWWISLSIQMQQVTYVMRTISEFQYLVTSTSSKQWTRDMYKWQLNLSWKFAEVSEWLWLWIGFSMFIRLGGPELASSPKSLSPSLLYPSKRPLGFWNHEAWHA